METSPPKEPAEEAAAAAAAAAASTDAPSAVAAITEDKIEIKNETPPAQIKPATDDDDDKDLENPKKTFNDQESSPSLASPSSCSSSCPSSSTNTAMNKINKLEFMKSELELELESELESTPIDDKKELTTPELKQKSPNDWRMNPIANHSGHIPMTTIPTPSTSNNSNSNSKKTFPSLLLPFGAYIDSLGGISNSLDDAWIDVNAINNGIPFLSNDTTRRPPLPLPPIINNPNHFESHFNPNDFNDNQQMDQIEQQPNKIHDDDDQDADADDAGKTIELIGEIPGDVEHFYGYDPIDSIANEIMDNFWIGVWQRDVGQQTEQRRKLRKPLVSYVGGGDSVRTRETIQRRIEAMRLGYDNDGQNLDSLIPWQFDCNPFEDDANDDADDDHREIMERTFGKQKKNKNDIEVKKPRGRGRPPGSLNVRTLRGRGRGRGQSRTVAAVGEATASNKLSISNDGRSRRGRGNFVADGRIRRRGDDCRPSPSSSTFDNSTESAQPRRGRGGLRNGISRSKITTNLTGFEEDSAAAAAATTVAPDNDHDLYSDYKFFAATSQKNGRELRNRTDKLINYSENRDDYQYLNRLNEMFFMKNGRQSSSSSSPSWQNEIQNPIVKQERGCDEGGRGTSATTTDDDVARFQSLPDDNKKLKELAAVPADHQYYECKRRTYSVNGQKSIGTSTADLSTFVEEQRQRLNVNKMESNDDHIENSFLSLFYKPSIYYDQKYMVVGRRKTLDGRLEYLCHFIIQKCINAQKMDAELVMNVDDAGVADENGNGDVAGPSSSQCNFQMENVRAILPNNGNFDNNSVSGSGNHQNNNTAIRSLLTNQHFWVASHHIDDLNDFDFDQQMQWQNQQPSQHQENRASPAEAKIDVPPADAPPADVPPAKATATETIDKME